MFGRKKKNTKSVKDEKKPSIKMQVIPDVFYGGVDPEIYHAQGLKSTEKKGGNGKVLKNVGSKVPKQSGSRKKIIIGSSVVFVLLVAGISWYYVSQYNNSKEQIDTVPVKTIDVVKDIPDVSDVTEPEDSATSTIVLATSTEDLIDFATSTPSLEATFLEFPPLLLLDTSDIDGDNLTDIEEELFGTDSGTWDTDQDGYFDGQEIFNLYNPRGFAPVKLIDSGVIKEYVNPLGYRVYYPLSWQTGDVDPNERQVLFSSISGDYVEIRIVDKEPRQTFIQWFGKNSEGQFFNDLKEFTNRFEQKGLRRKDDLVVYFDSDRFVYVIIYHPKDRAPVAYRHVLQMMYQGFRIQKTDIALPDQELFPGVLTPETTSTEAL